MRRIFTGHAACPQKRALCHGRRWLQAIMPFANWRGIAFFGPERGSALHILLLQSFAKLMAGEILPARLREMGQKLGAGDFAVRIGDQRRRWGSCSRRDRQMPKICLNWRGLLLAPILLDQLCLHELCHLVEMNHSPAFHALLAAHNPLERQHERELGLAWKNLPPWAVHHSHFAAGRTR